MLTAVNWRRNLAALWLAEFTAIMGFSFAFPFLPLFLHRELHIPNGPELSFWTGVSASATGFALAGSRVGSATAAFVLGASLVLVLKSSSNGVHRT